MKRMFGRKLMVGCLIGLMSAPPGTVQAAPPFWKSKKAVTATELLATEIDALEKYVNDQGTVVAKAPDIWGEARLTKHRHEFEIELAKELKTFKPTINASIRATDQAFLGAALAISSTDFGTSGPDFTVLNNLAVGSGVAAETGSVPITRKAPATPTGFKDEKIELEPVIRLDQMKRYLDHLQEIRRINEGDDVADTPGYSLNLVRIPISVLPGDATRKGFGAEVTVTATPHITPELLPTVYRQLVINDLIDQWHVAVSQMAVAIARVPGGGANPTSSLFPTPPSTPVDAGLPGVEVPRPDEAAPGPRPVPPAQPVPGATPPVNSRPANSNDGAMRPVRGADLSAVRPLPTFGRSEIQQVQGVSPALPAAGAVGATQRQYQELDSNPDVRKAVVEAQKSLVVALSAGVRRSRLPLPVSQFVETFGRGLRSIAFDFYRRSGVDSDEAASRSKPGHDLFTRLGPLEARSYLRDEIEGAYDYLLRPAALSLWGKVPEIVDAVRRNDVKALQALRAEVVKTRNYDENTKKDFEFQWENEHPLQSPSSGSRETPTTTFAWAILVHAALLNEQLNQDVKRVSEDPNCHCLKCDCEQAFYLPDPSPEARQAFIDYVQCRWPVHVFALDPVAQDQNVIDTFSLRRELQLAFALSIATGRMRPNSPAVQSMQRYARRLELDVETIALNKTAVAFAHGEDTFGWRFYPRVQTPQFESNTTVLFRDLLIGGPSKDALRNHWEIEPGPRECTALVVMPSFIDHMRFDVRGGFFKLKTPDNQKATILSDVKWSQRIRQMHDLAEAVSHEQELYRDGEVDRLLKRVSQLEKRLPLQTVHSRVPNENTFGGFEMFSSGTTDLAPELFGFYGEPGVNPAGETELFLHGENFSIHGTQVIAGNKSCQIELLSRQVMKVTIPKGVRTIHGTGDLEYVDLHLATPYGVTRHLEIPVDPPKEAPAAATGFRFGTSGIAVQYGYTTDGKGAYSYVQTRTAPPHELAIVAPPGTRLPATTNLVLTISAGEDLGRAPLVATVELPNLPLDPEKRAYVIQNANYAKLFKDIRDGLVATNVVKSEALASSETRLLLSVRGAVGGLADPILEPLWLTVTFEEVRATQGPTAAVPAPAPAPTPAAAAAASTPPATGGSKEATTSAPTQSAGGKASPALNPPASGPKAMASRR